MHDVGRGAAQIAELHRIHRAFEQIGIPVVAVKGVVLSMQIYGDPVLRSARDIDLLVDPASFGAAHDVMLACGYQPVTRDSAARRSEIDSRWTKELEYLHVGSNVRVELHHRLTDNPNLLPYNVQTLWAEHAEVRVGQTTIVTLPPRVLPIYLCVHGALHGWDRLQWLVDLATLLRTPEVAEAALVEAERTGLSPLMLHAMSLAHQWLGARIGERYRRQAEVTPRVQWLNCIFAKFYGGSAWRQQPSRNSWRGKWRYSGWLRLYRFALKSSWRYCLCELVRELYSPADRETLRLPPLLSWLYPFYRPIGWLFRRHRSG